MVQSGAMTAANPVLLLRPKTGAWVVATFGNHATGSGVQAAVRVESQSTGAKAEG